MGRLVIHSHKQKINKDKVSTNVPIVDNQQTSNKQQTFIIMIMMMIITLNKKGDHYPPLKEIKYLKKIK